jgi:Ca2+-binding RTX toxin-like protein
MIGDINTINLGLGNDQVTMLSNGQTTLKTSNGDNLLNLSGTGTFNVSSGTGTDQISSGSGNDILNSGSGADILNANAGNDHLIAGAGNDTLIGGTGDDLLEGGSDNDSYQFNAGDGKDLIKDSSGIDQAAFGNGVAKDDLWFMRSGKDLVVNNTKTLDEIKVNNWFASKNNQLESFSLASGEVLSGQAVASLIQAMAAFNPQPMAESMMTSAQQAQFQDLLKNTWVDPTK